MDIQTEKLRLIEWLAGLNDSETINEFITLKEKKEMDWWDQISAEERSEIEEGLAQADRGELIPHEEVMAKYKKWL
jgi:predicted transcriptional regulator